MGSFHDVGLGCGTISIRLEKPCEYMRMHSALLTFSVLAHALADICLHRSRCDPTRPAPPSQL